MSVSLSKSSDLRPSDGVRVVSTGTEQGFEGYVRKTPSLHAGEVLVRVTSTPEGLDGYKGMSLSYRASSLVRTRRNGK